MARVGSGDSFDVGTWADGDNPGAGSQDFGVFSDTGLNGNFKRFWRAIKDLLKNDGTLNNDKITGASIQASAFDGSTLETTNPTGSKQARIKDAGVTMAKIAQAGATTGQAITWSGSAWAPGAPTAVLSDGYVTRAKMQDQAKMVTSYNLFNDARVAGTTSGSAVAAVTEWSETTAGGAVKLECFLRPRKENRYITLTASAKTDNATRAWTVELLVDDVVQDTATGTNTSYNLSAPEAQCDYLVNAGSGSSAVPIKVGVRIKCVSPSTVTMKNVVLAVAATNAND